MFITYAFDLWPSWAIYIFFVSVFCLTAEIGYRIGKYRNRSVSSPDAIQTSGIVGPVIALVAFLLAFSFGLASSHFAARKQLIIQEANAIGTAFLRADLLPEQQEQNTKALLREYLNVRLDSVRAKDQAAVEETMNRSERIQNQLWSQAVALKKDHSDAIMRALFIESINEVIDLHTKRVSATFGNRIPKGIRLTLFFIAMVSILLRGYTDGLMGKVRSMFGATMLILAFTAVLVLILDLDRPPFTDQRLLDLSNQALIDLQRAFQLY